MEKIKITIPESWAEVSLRKFIEINNINQDNELLKSIEIISILSDVDPELIKNSSPESLDQILKNLEWTKQEPSTEYKVEIEIEDETYYLVRLRSLSNGEWADLDTWNEDRVNNIHKIMALLYRKKDEEYNTRVCAERAELFLDHMNYGDVYGTMLFFCLIAMKFSTHLETFISELKTTKMT